MSDPTQEEWAILLPAYRALKAEWEAGRKPVVITSARYEALMAALTKIAFGRTDNGRPLGGETARQMARDACTASGIQWSAPSARPND